MIKEKKRPSKLIYAFIDASNLFYGGEKSLGWKIDYKKLLNYLKKRYGVSRAFYYAGVELDRFTYSVLDKNPIQLKSLLFHLRAKLKNKNLSEAKIVLLGKHIQRVKFYLNLEKFGYRLRLKPVKIFTDLEGNTTKKANCDVDMTFDLMRYINDYFGVLILSGDGDFTVVLKYLKDMGKDVKILARGERTAREIRQLAGSEFRDFNYLREILKYKK